MHDTAPATVTARGDIDLATAPRLRRVLARALKAHRDVVLDLSEVTFVDRAGLGALVEARNLAGRRGGRLVLWGAGPRVVRLIRLTGLGGYLAVERGPAVDAAACSERGETRGDSSMGSVPGPRAGAR
ncbi:STAS domain-containing protein [Kitasatospora sp. NPDC085879]|uniref:STAS domain-containing protein n=1 Tax=Kitasatospora sp. NPDC085879 TaxID=3154769 RepID=UPI00343A06BE